MSHFLPRLSPKALFFDLDGTLIESVSGFHDALKETLQPYGFTLTAQDHQFLVGRGWDEMYSYLSQKARLPVSLTALAQEVDEVRHHQIKTRGSKELTGASSFVKKLSQKFPCALVTGSGRRQAELILQQLGIDSHFQFLICAGETDRCKPAPDPYLLAAQKMALDPKHCLAFEDSLVGIESARSAGMYCVAVRAGNFANQDQSGADLIIETLEEIESWFQSH